MKIGFVWDWDYPWDIRVEKICKSLVGAGHEVHMVCRNSKNQPRKEVIDGIYIHRMPSIKASKVINHVINFPLFFNPVWYLNILNVTKNANLEIIIVRDITLSLTALVAAKSKNIPVILDMAEPYPEMIRAQHQYEKMGLIKKIVRNVKIAEWVENQTLKRVRLTLAMVEESKNRLKKMGVPEQRVCVVSNTPDIKKYSNAKPSYPGSLAKLKSKIKLLYVGYINKYRGLGTAVQAMERIIKIDGNVVLIVVGSGSGEEDLKNMSEKLNVSKHVFFEGHHHHSLILDYISSSDIGIITHYPCGLWDNTVPNKLFDYMFMGKPVLSSDTKPVKRILEEEQCGLVYRNNDLNEFVQNTIKLLDPAVRNKLGKNGKNAVNRRYNWEFDSKVMLDNVYKVVAT